MAIPISPLPPPDAPEPRVLITGGPTAEDIDPVRFISNRSTGRMGIELAAAVRGAGGTPLLVLGPTHLEPPPEIATIRVRSADDMCRAVVDNFAWCQALVMSAAVADYTPAEPLATKLKKQEGGLVLRLRRTPDILRTVMDLPGHRDKVVFGFSLDVGMNLEEGERKLREKGLDLIVVNTTSSFGTDCGGVWILTRRGREDRGNLPKDRLAAELASRIGEFLQRKRT